jgi:hypothetical protein
MGFIGKLFGTDKAINDLVDKDNGLLVRAGTALGNLNYSDQEKAEWGIRVLDAISPFKVVQRILAFAAMFMWLFLGINLVVAVWIEAYHPEIKAVDALQEFAFSDYVFWPALSIFALYTGGGTINSLKGNK